VTSYIYIIGSDKPPYKVGISKNPQRRLKDLQTGHPYPLTIHSIVETSTANNKLLESVIHRNLRHLRTNGEWFDIPLERLKLEVDFVMIRYSKDPTLKTRVTQNIL
jgi:Meiotically up-regulated gene 113